MRKICVLFFLLLITNTALWSAFDSIDLSSDIALLMDVETGHVLYEKNADTVTSPASITKIATALYTLKEIGDDVLVKVKADQDCIGSITAQMQKDMNYRHPPHWLILGGTHMSITKNEQLTLEELLYGLMLVSANDAANVIAKYVAGSISQFMVDLNDYLAEIGCKNTHFKNPHGLHLPHHETTARDMAKITIEAMKYPLFRKIIQTSAYEPPNRPASKNNILQNSNLLVRRGHQYFYPQAIGGKTGKHTEAKNSLVAIAQDNGRTLLVVLMQCPEFNQVFLDAKTLFQIAFDENRIQEVYLSKGPQPFKCFLPDSNKKLHTYLKEDVTLTYFPSEKPQVKGEITWLYPNLPISKGDVVAMLSLKNHDEELLKEVPLFASHAIGKQSLLKKISFYFLMIVVVTALFFFGRYILKSASRAS